MLAGTTVELIVRTRRRGLTYYVLLPLEYIDKGYIRATPMFQSRLGTGYCEPNLHVWCASCIKKH